MSHCSHHHYWAQQHSWVWQGITSLLWLLERAEDMATLQTACAAPA